MLLSVLFSLLFSFQGFCWGLSVGAALLPLLIGVYFLKGFFRGSFSSFLIFFYIHVASDNIAYRIYKRGLILLSRIARRRLSLNRLKNSMALVRSPLGFISRSRLVKYASNAYSV